MATDAGWRPLQRPERPAVPGLASSPFGRLAVAHAVLLAGDALVTVALAGSLFFSISPGAAKPRVALYLALTMAPLAVVAPMVGPLLDRSRAGRRLVVVATGAGRAVACALMAGDLGSLLLFPEAFAVLVLSKAYSVTKSALVPSVVPDERGLVEANARLTLGGVLAGLVAAVPAIGIMELWGASWVLRLAVLVFSAGALAAVRIPPAAAPAPPLSAEAKAELRAANVVLAASAMGTIRAVVGFLTFLVAFSFRRDGAPSWWFGIVLAASMAGNMGGNLAAPRLRRRGSEEHLLLGTLVALAGTGLVVAAGRERWWAAVLAAVVGAGAAVAKLAFDALVQRDAPDAARGRAFARFESRFQLLWVVGAFVPVLVPIGIRLGALLIAVLAGVAAASYWAGSRAVGRRPRGAGLAALSGEGAPGPGDQARQAVEWVRRRLGR